MIRGFLGGAVLGAVVAVAGAGALSVLSMAPIKPARAPEAANVNVPAGSEFNQSRADDAASLPATAPVAKPEAAPKVAAAPEPDATPEAGEMSDPGHRPEAGGVETGLADTPRAEAGETAPATATAADAPVLADSRGAAPTAPQAEAELSISTDPAQPKPPVVMESESAMAAPAGGADTGTEDSASSPSGPAPEVHSVSPAEPAAPQVTLADAGSAMVGEPVKDSSQPVEAAEKLPEPELDQNDLVISVAPEATTPPEPTPTPVETPSSDDGTTDGTAQVDMAGSAGSEAGSGGEASMEPEPGQTAQTMMAEQAGQSDPAADQATGAAGQTTATEPETQTDEMAEMADAGEAAEAGNAPAASAAPVTETAEAAMPEPQPAKPNPVRRLETEGAAPAEGRAPLPGQGGGTIQIGKPAGSFKTVGARVRGDNVLNTRSKSSRLPSVGSGDGEAVTETVNTGDTAPAMLGDRSKLAPLQRYASDAQVPENKPKMAIVLIDEGTGPVGIEALANFPYPLSFAVDTARADAPDKMAIYRAAGFEVLAMVRLPEGAAPSDVEVAMPVLLEKVPEAVAVMEAPGDGIQSDRKISDQVARILADTGHGLLLFSKGLNTAQKLAAKNGVASATVFRDFDGAGQQPRTIRRFLNNGALKAGSEGGVVMVGRLRPDTVSALLLWGLEERASQIALSPVSRLLKVQP